MNSYEKALLEVGSVIEPYSGSGTFRMMGFGGEPHYLKSFDGKPSHCWNLSENNGQVKGATNLLSIYENCVRNTRLSGPTYFLHFLREFLTSVQNSSHNTYHVLVVLTDGSLHDEKPTRDLLVEMSYLPVSVIVVGIGQTDFKMMNQFNYESLKNSLG